MKRAIIVIAAAMLFVAGLFVASSGVRGQVASGARCLHDEDETGADRMRREQALSLARAINAAQGQAMQHTKRYQALAQLGNLPPTPDRFVVRLYTDGEGYMFSVKDDRDACQYGIFSDQNGFLYQSSPTPPLIAS